jgi:hypothetical protein
MRFCDSLADELCLLCTYSCAGNPILDKAGKPLMVDADEEEGEEGDGKDEEEKKVRHAVLWLGVPCAAVSTSVPDCAGDCFGCSWSQFSILSLYFSSD